MPQAGYELSSSDVFSEVPESGAVWGDGTLISWTFADGGEHIVGVDMSYVNDAGDAIPMSGIFLDDMGGGRWARHCSCSTPTPTAGPAS